MKVSTYLILAAIGVLITLIRVLIAGKQSKAEKQEAEQTMSRNKTVMEEQLRSAGMNADEVFEDACASATLDEKQAKLTIVSSGGGLFAWSGGDNCTYDLREIDRIEMIDHSEEYKEAQEMHCYYTGVKRDSMYNPYGKHKMREVKTGEEKFGEFFDQTVYGIKVVTKGGDEKEYAFYRGTESAFWTQGEKPIQLRRFVERCNACMRSAAV